MERNAVPFCNFGTDVEQMSSLGNLGSDFAWKLFH